MVFLSYTAPLLFLFQFMFLALKKKKESYLYLGLPHQHIPINKAGGEVAVVAGSGEVKCGPEAEQWACAK